MGLRLLSTLVGKKLGMALTGLVLYGFLIGHLSGNLLLLKEDGGKAFNAYSDFLLSHPLLVPAELFLLACFFLHIYLGISVSHENRRARPQGYVQGRRVGGANWASRSMIYSGVLILVFLVIHLKTFKYGDRGGGTLYDLVNSTFAQTGYLVWYFAAMVGLGFHLWHAFQSAFQTLSLNSPLLKKLGLALSLVLGGLFALLPLYVGLLK